MKVYQTLGFEKTVKKLFPNQKKILDKAIREILENPLIGQQKKGDLRTFRVYKFNMLGSQVLFAYLFNEEEPSITAVKLGAHENFYRDLK